MYRHGVTVEVSVEGLTNEWVNLDGLAVDEYGLEGLHTETVKRRCTVQEHGVLASYVLELLPHRNVALLDHALRGTNVLRRAVGHEGPHYEWLEEFERHDLRQTALVQLQTRTNDDDRTGRVVNALTEQVLAETTLLTLQHVGEALGGTARRTRGRAAVTTVVDQGVNGLLQHAAFVVHDDRGAVRLEQLLETVVAVDHVTVEVVQVTGGLTSTVELHHRTQVRWDDGKDLQDHRAGVVHPSTVVVAAVEGLDNGETLEQLGVTLGGNLYAALTVEHFDHLRLFGVEVHAVDELQDCVGTHATFEVLLVPHEHFAVEQFVFDDLTGVQRTERVEGLVGHVDGQLGTVTSFEATLVEFLLRGAQFGVTRVVVLQVLQASFELALVALEGPLATGQDVLGLVFEGFGQRLEVFGAASHVNEGHETSGVVDNLLQLLGLELFLRVETHQEVGQPRTGTTEVPDVDNGSLKLDVTHALAAHLVTRYFNATTLTNETLDVDALVLTTGTLPSLLRSEDLLAEESVLLRLVGAVVNGFWLLDFARGP